MSRKYTAQEMREMANDIDLIRLFGPIDSQESDQLYRAMMMLRQAADIMDRERKFEYTAEYVKRRSGKVDGKCAYHFDSLDRAKRFKYYPLKGEKLRFIRREVGEWEQFEEVSE